MSCSTTSRSRPKKPWDELAERAVQLGGTARGSIRLAANASALGEYPLDIVDGDAHLKALVAAMAKFGRQIRDGIELAAKLGDANTSDLFTEISRSADKQLWMVEAHLQGKGLNDFAAALGTRRDTPDGVSRLVRWCTE
jgi:starvation-inducible DNA-binding protein